MNYSIISKYRTELMGVAILWILLFHSSIQIDFSLYIYPVKYIKEIGYGGVDMFFFLSGFGLSCGIIKKKYSSKIFYYKRFSRILPAYYIIMILSIFIAMIRGKEITFIGSFLKLSTLGFWINTRRYDWFIPSLIACYILFPMIYNIYKKNPKKEKTIINATIISLVLCLFVILIEKNYLLIFLTRLPLFVIGMHFGRLSLESDALITKEALIYNIFFLICGTASLYFVFQYFPLEQRWKYGFWWYPFIFITPALCVFLSVIAVKIKNSQIRFIFKPAQKMLFFCGVYSLEIYLLHQYVFGFGNSLLNSEIVPNGLLLYDKTHIFEYILYLVLTLSFSVPLKKVSRIAQNKLDNIFQVTV